MSEIVMSVMMSMTPAVIAGLVGMVAGVVGVSFAVYLQLLSPEKCPPRYVFEFFTLGSALILINFAVLDTGIGVVGEWLPVLGNTIILLLELWALHYVLQEIEIKPPQPVYDPTDDSL